MQLIFSRLLLILFLCYAIPTFADDVEKYEIQIQNHRFIPEIITAPADKVIKIKVVNLDSTVEEFESFDLKREKIVPANGGNIVITLGPLKPGEYSFFGEFNMDTAQGKLIIK